VYWIVCGLGAVVGLIACESARRNPSRYGRPVGRAIALLLAADALVFVLRPAIDGGWTAQDSLPLNLCDAALVIAAVACWNPRWQTGVELTYFWGLAGTLQALITPDLSARFPSVTFFEFVVGHLGIVLAAVLLVVSLGRRPRRGSAARVFAITLAYTAAVGVLDWQLDANYMYLRRVPGHASLLSDLGPWPYYLLSAAGVAAVLFAVLATPFYPRGAANSSSSARPASRLRQPAA
jgi:hypothetical integral membrane protein (TIGR02206 family)